MGKPTFRKSTPYEDRVRLSQKILSEYPDRVPVLVEGGPKAPPITKTKFLAPSDVDVSRFIHEIRKHIAIPATDALFVFVGDPPVMPQPGALMSTIYGRHKQDDGFLYVHYTLENTFG